MSDQQSTTAITPAPQSNETTALEKAPKGAPHLARIAWTERGAQLQNMEDTWNLCTALARSGFFTDAKDAGTAFAIVQAGAELGFDPFASLAGIFKNTKSGRLGHYAQFQLALILRRGGRYVVKQNDHKGAVIEWYRNDWLEPGKYMLVGVSSFDIDDANKAGLMVRDTYEKYARDMFFSRAVTRGRVQYFSDYFNGGGHDILEEILDDGDAYLGRNGDVRSAKADEEKTSTKKKGATEKIKAVVGEVLEGEAGAVSTPTPQASSVAASSVEVGEQATSKPTPATATPSAGPSSASAGAPVPATATPTPAGDATASPAALSPSDPSSASSSSSAQTNTAPVVDKSPPPTSTPASAPSTSMSKPASESAPDKSPASSPTSTPTDASVKSGVASLGPEGDEKTVAAAMLKLPTNDVDLTTLVGLWTRVLSEEDQDFLTLCCRAALHHIKGKPALGKVPEEKRPAVIAAFKAAGKLAMIGVVDG